MTPQHKPLGGYIHLWAAAISSLILVCCVLNRTVNSDTLHHLSDRFCLVHGDPEFLVELGSAWNRYDFCWNGIERTKGIFDFRDLAPRVDESLRQGVNILPILDYEAAWDPDHSPADEETLGYWARYVRKTVATFKGKLHYWQVWNEPNLTFWKPKPNARDYAELLRRSYLAAKGVDPDVKIVGVNCSNIDLEFTEQVFRYGGLKYCDVLAYQPYRIAPEVGHFEEVQALRELVARFGEQRPIWFTEMGWATQHFPFADADDLLAEKPSRRQAAFLVRYMVIIQAVDIEKVFWFAQSAGGHGLEDRKRGKKRLSFYAYRHLIATLDNYESVSEIIPHGSGGLYAYLFSCPDKSVVVAWSVNGPQKVAIPGASLAVEARDMLGNRIEKPKTNYLRLTGEPIYLVFENTPTVLAKKESIRINPSRVWLFPGERKSVSLLWEASVDLSRKYRIKIRAPHGLSVNPKTISLTPGEKTSFIIRAGKIAQPARDFIRISCGDVVWNVEVNIAPRKLWEYHGESKGYLSPSIVQDRNGNARILVAAYDTPEILCLSPQGESLWKYTAGAPINCSVTVGNINKDPQPEIIAAMPSKQTIIALTSKGVLMWRANIPGQAMAEKPGWRWTRPEVADLDGDGIGEIVYADYNGRVTTLSGEGHIFWSKKLSEQRCDRPIFVGNIRGDESPDILVGDEKGTLFCIADKGDVIWKTSVDADITATPVAGSLMPGAPVSIFVGTKGERLLRISPDGKIIWSVPLGGTMDLGSGIVLTDLDDDGKKEIVVSTRNHEVIALDADGMALWRVEAGAQIRSIPAIGDVDGDGENEILIGSADWMLYCIDRQGNVEWTVNVGNRVDASPLLMDLNHDGVEDIILPVRGGDVFAFSSLTSGR